MRFYLLLAVFLAAPALAEPARFHLSKPINQWVEIGIEKPKVHLKSFVSGSGQSLKSELEVSWKARSQRLPLDTVADELNTAARGEVIVEDFDFDGVKDLGIPTSSGYGGVNIYYNLFRLDQKSGTFVPFAEKAAVCNPEFDFFNKILVTNTRSGPCWYGSDYKFKHGQPWLFRRRSMLILDELLLKPQVAYLVESLNAKGQVTDSLVSADSLKKSRFTGILDKDVMLFPSPGSRGLRGHLKKGQSVTIDRWNQWAGHEYVRVTAGPVTGWVLIANGAVKR
jgi:hypothetical protein